jgi:hypothetical protein
MPETLLVAVGPGDTMFMRMPSLPYSTATLTKRRVLLVARTAVASCGQQPLIALTRLAAVVVERHQVLRRAIRAEVLLRRRASVGVR